jgi:hypothetical protein
VDRKFYWAERDSADRPNRDRRGRDLKKRQADGWVPPVGDPLKMKGYAVLWAVGLKEIGRPRSFLPPMLHEREHFLTEMTGALGFGRGLTGGALGRRRRSGEVAAGS